VCDIRETPQAIVADLLARAHEPNARLLLYASVQWSR